MAYRKRYKKRYGYRRKRKKGRLTMYDVGEGTHSVFDIC